MLDVKECCRLCIKPKQQSMQDCANDPLAVKIQDIFGIEIIVNGPLSTKVCRECVFKVLDIYFFKSTVQNNQATLEEYRILQESLQLNPPEVKQEDDDDVILIEANAPKSTTNGGAVEQYEENIKKFKRIETEQKVKIFTVKRSLNPASMESPERKKIKLKKLKVLCHPINAKDVSQFRLKEADKRILKLNRKEDERKKTTLRFKVNEQKSCEPTSLAAKNLVSIIVPDSEDKDNDDETIQTIKDNFDESNKKSAVLAETSNVSMSSTSGVSTPQNVASVGSLTIPLPTTAPSVKVINVNSNLKQYGAKNTFSKQITPTPLVSQMPKQDILYNTPRNLSQPKLVVNQLNLSVNQPNPANLPKPANQLKPQNLPNHANQPKPSKPTNQMEVINQPNNKPSTKTTQNSVSGTQKGSRINWNIGIQPIPTGRSVESQAKIIPAPVPAPVPAPPHPIIRKVNTVLPLTIPNNAEEDKVSKLLIFNGKVFNHQGDCLGAVGNSLRHIQTLAQANGNTLTFKVTQSEAQKWQAVIDKRNTSLPGRTIIPIAGMTISTVPGVQIVSHQSSVPSTAAAASSSMRPFPVQLASNQQSPSPNILQNSKRKLLDGSRPPPPNVTPGMSPHPTFGEPVTDTQIKVLSVNELNNRAADPNSDTRKLPIRITLVKIKNEVQIKLTDSKGFEIHYCDLTAQEQLAVKTSLLQPSSKIQIISAIRSCKPDAYSEKMLQAFGISETDLL